LDLALAPVSTWLFIGCVTFDKALHFAKALLPHLVNRSTPWVAKIKGCIQKAPGTVGTQ
jgi:hypothetical protein